LGAVRDKDFLCSDTKDTDIALDDKYYWKIRQLFDKYAINGEFRWYGIHRKELSVASNDNQFKVDLFFMEAKDDKYLVYSYKPNPENKKWNYEWRAIFTKDAIFPTKSIRFLGRYVKIPNDYELILTEEYGKWRTPDPTWVSSDTKVLNADREYEGFYPAGINVNDYIIDTNKYDVGFICVNVLRKEETKACVNSLRAFCPYVKVYIADQDEPCAEMIQFYEQNHVEYYYLPFDCGLSYARNFLLEKVKEPYLMWGDNDFIFTEQNGINDAKEILTTYDDIGFVGGAVKVNQTIQHYERLLSYDSKNKTLIYIPLEYTSPDKITFKDMYFYYCDLTFNYVLCKTNVLKDNKHLRWNENLKVSYEHSIKEDTPILIKHNKEIKVIEIQDLMPDCFKNLERKEYKLNNIKIWTQEGWRKINSVISHKYKGELYQLITRNSFLECSSDHSLIIKNKPVTPKMLSINNSIELLKFPNLTDKYDIDLDWAWMLGFFLAEGNLSESKNKWNSLSWKIQFINQNKKLLDKCKKILLKANIETDFIKTSKRKDKCYFLYLKKPRKYKEIFNEFYNKNLKTIPSSVFQWKKESRLAFFKGFLAGDGSKKTRGNGLQFSQKSKLVVQGLLYLIKDLYPYYTLFYLTTKLGSWFSVTVFDKIYRHKMLLPKNILKSINHKTYKGILYDINIVNNSHTFSGGIGNVNLHNTDAFLKIKLYSDYKVVYFPFMIVEHKHITGNVAYQNLRVRKTDCIAFAESWGLRMNFTINQGREIYNPYQVHTTNDLNKMKPERIERFDQIEKKIVPPDYTPLQALLDFCSILDRFNINYVLTKITCLEVVNHARITQNKIYLAIDALFKNLNKDVFKEAEFIFNEEDATFNKADIKIYCKEQTFNETKIKELAGKNFKVPNPVSVYLKGLYGDQWNKK
jgi:hypothetical protein